MILTGDVNLRNVTDPSKPFELVADILRQEDVVFGNLEGCLSDVVDDYLYSSKHLWRHAGTAGAPALKLGGFDAVGCANNVTYGAEAILSSLAVLDEMGLPHTGAGIDMKSARIPVVLDRNGTSYGFLQYTSVFWPIGHEANETSPGVATVKTHTAYLPTTSGGNTPPATAITLTWPDSEYLKRFEEDILALRDRVDVLVVSCHWGVSGSDEIPQYQVDLGHAAIDAGADLVFGHGAHVIQAIEVYNDAPIFYSLGNFSFGWEPMGPDWVGLMVQAEIQNKKITRVSCSPVKEDNHTDRRTVIRSLSEEREAMKVLARQSDMFNTDLDFNGDRVLVLERS